MTTKNSIKIIKRNEREAVHAQETAAAVANTEQKKTAPQAARDVVATVTEWVNEFQQKRRTETAHALKTLFTDSTPQPSKA